MRLTNPRVFFLLIVVILAAGAASIQRLGRQEDPPVRSRAATIVTRLSGATPERVESLVTEHIETSMQEIREIERMSSISSSGLSVVTIRAPGRVDDIDDLWSRVRDHLADARRMLPPTASVPEFRVRKSMAATMLASFVWTQDAPPQVAILTRLAQELARRMRALPGTDEAQIYGEAEEEILVAIDPALLHQTRLGRGEVARRLARADAKISSGRLPGDPFNPVVEIAGAFDSAARVRDTVLAADSDGRVLRVGSIAEVTKGVRSPPRAIALVNGKRAVVVAAKVRHGSRADQWAEVARREIAEYQQTLPDEITLETTFDQSEYTSNRLRSLAKMYSASGAIVFTTVLILMGWRSGLIVSLLLPLSTATTLAVFGLLGGSLHQVSITGLVIALGILIDNGIVVVDELDDRVRRGEDAESARRNTVKRLRVPLFASTATTALSFAPVVLAPGSATDFVAPMATVVIVSVVSSFLLSLTLIPAFAVLLKPSHAKSSRSRACVDFFGQRYRGALNFAVNHPCRMVAVSSLLPLFGFVSLSLLDHEFFPTAHRDQFRIQLTLAPSASIEQTRRAVSTVQTILDEYPEIESCSWFIGQGAPRVYYNDFTGQHAQSNYAGAIVAATSADRARWLIPRLQSRFITEVPDAIALALPFRQGPPVRAPIEIRVSGPEVERLRVVGGELRSMLAEVPGVLYTHAEITGGEPKVHLLPDEGRLRELGLDVSDLAGQVASSLIGQVGGSVMDGSSELPVRVRSADAHRRHLSELASTPIYLPREHAAAIPLVSLASITVRPQAAGIAHWNGQRTNTILAYMEPFGSPSIVLSRIRSALSESQFAPPTGYLVSFGGESENRRDTIADLISWLVPLALTMLAVIVISLNSFRLALLVGLVGIASVGYGALALWAASLPLSFTAVVGIVGLVGLAINSAIVVVDELGNRATHESMTPALVSETIASNTRHVLGTALTTLGGFTPLALVGGNFWPPVAITIGGGVLGSTVLSLFFVPSFYLILTKTRPVRGQSKFEKNESRSH